MGEREQVGRGGGTKAVLERIAASKTGVVEGAPDNKDGVRPAAHRMARLVRVLVCCSVFIGTLLLVPLAVGVACFGFLIFLF
ncbi:hypothetical protein J2W56_005974 [Nocardia kruczakiae]|uniref:Transmembrane protein n=1 Tax=Nocardia kruczakiae TaxID=261477 RepID=A0ABU1XNV0_9NOCA|nr:hypothetical protein [Nocardia kruczakiae]MDR7172213.1 hypothetical protein [Nocardia kruczakiae]